MSEYKDDEMELKMKQLLDKMKSATDIVLKPPVRCSLPASGLIRIHRITSDHMKRYVGAVLRKCNKDTQLEMEVKIFNRKKYKDDNGSIPYTILHFALSDDVVEKSADRKWIEHIVDSGVTPRFTENVFQNVIKRFGYNIKELKNIANNYKAMDKIYEKFGLVEEDIGKLIELSIPKRIVTNREGGWVTFAASPEAVISDMLINPCTGKPDGRIHIVSITPISNSMVEYLVYVYINEYDVIENNEVKQIMKSELNKR